MGRASSSPEPRTSASGGSRGTAGPASSSPRAARMPRSARTSGCPGRRSRSGAAARGSEGCRRPRVGAGVRTEGRRQAVAPHPPVRPRRHDGTPLPPPRVGWAAAPASSRPPRRRSVSHAPPGPAASVGAAGRRPLRSRVQQDSADRGDLGGSPGATSSPAVREVAPGRSGATREARHAAGAAARGRARTGPGSAAGGPAREPAARRGAIVTLRRRRPRPPSHSETVTGRVHPLITLPRRC